MVLVSHPLVLSGSNEYHGLHISFREINGAGAMCGISIKTRKGYTPCRFKAINGIEKLGPSSILW